MKTEKQKEKTTEPTEAELRENFELGLKGLKLVDEIRVLKAEMEALTKKRNMLLTLATSKMDELEEIKKKLHPFSTKLETLIQQKKEAK